MATNVRKKPRKNGLGQTNIRISKEFRGRKKKRGGKRSRR